MTEQQQPARSFVQALASTFQPLHDKMFARLWTASLFFNAGQQIQGVAAAWLMVQMTTDPGMVSLVQTASTAPIMLLALPGGALADIYDRRKAAMGALLISLTAALALMLLALNNMLTPLTLLLGCVVVGSGMALYAPAWQASLFELVGAKALSGAIALNSTSVNLARAGGAALAGVLVATVGAAASFAINAILYLPMLLAFRSWKRAPRDQTLPPEDLSRATLSGLRYLRLTPPIRRILLRSVFTGLGMSSAYALMPLIAHTLLRGDAGTYGVLLSAFGAGALISGLLAGVLRGRWPVETTVRFYAVLQGASIVVVALSPWLGLSALAMLINGLCWVTNNATYNVSLQMTAPRWIAGRMIALLYASVAGGLALGSWIWGLAAGEIGLSNALLVSGVVLAASALIGIALPLPNSKSETLSVPAENSPDVKLPLDARSGPIVVMVEYRIAPERVAEFSALMGEVRRVLERNGAFGFSLSRDLSDTNVWVERVHYTAWHDYVRARDRPTQAERELRTRALAFHQGPEPHKVRRLLERGRTLQETRREEEAADIVDANSGGPPL